jgi:hypothetical protein
MRIIQKIKWWWTRNDIVYVFGFDGPRGIACKRIRPKHWWEKPDYKKL